LLSFKSKTFPVHSTFCTLFKYFFLSSFYTFYVLHSLHCSNIFFFPLFRHFLHCSCICSQPWYRVIYLLNVCPLYLFDFSTSARHPICILLFMCLCVCVLSLRNSEQVLGDILKELLLQSLNKSTLYIKGSAVFFIILSQFKPLFIYLNCPEF